MPMMTDPAAERAVLAGVCEYGGDAYLDICDMVKVGTFSINSNQCIWKCLEHICKDNDSAKIDLPSIISAASSLGLSHIVERQEEAKHLNSILKLHVDRTNLNKFAGKIRRLEVARLVHKQAQVLQEKMLEIDGSQAIQSILGVAEDTIFDFTSLLDDNTANPARVGHDIQNYIEYLEKNPVQQLGISTGFRRYDEAIGGGLRPATLNVIAARPKTGKTVLTDNIGFYIAETEKIPVLNMDTEMLKEDHLHRTLAMLSGVKIREVETGQFGQDPVKRNSVKAAGERMSAVPYYHKSIAGMPFEDQLALMRRWLQREVGLNPDGTAKPCVIIYDYLKLMDSVGISDSMREFQLLGFMMSTLHNFGVRYKIPFLILMQLNRDGIDREETDTASGSDRIVWLCSNFTIFKKKSEEEIGEDGPMAGNRKMVILACRHGEGTAFGDYINYKMEGWKASIVEGRFKSELDQQNHEPDDFIPEENENNPDIPFD